MFSKDPSKIIIPYNREQLDALLMFDDDWKIAIGNHCHQILHHLPSHALFIQKLRKNKLSIVFPHQILQRALSVINQMLIHLEQ